MIVRAPAGNKGDQHGTRSADQRADDNQSGNSTGGNGSMSTLTVRIAGKTSLSPQSALDIFPGHGHGP
jgi:hypothetical protein